MGHMTYTGLLPHTSSASVGIAALYLAFKLPLILLLPVVGAAYQDAAHGGLNLASTISALMVA